MDKGIRYISAIRGDKHWPYRPYLEGLWPCGFFFMVALTCLGACGGGGSGSASSSQGVAVTEPPAIRQVARVPLLFGESYQSEYARQSGLAGLDTIRPQIPSEVPIALIGPLRPTAEVQEGHLVICPIALARPLCWRRCVFLRQVRPMCLLR